MNRACKAQPHLTRRWVAKQELRHGRTVGRLLPHVEIGNELLEGLEELTGIPFSSGAARD